jgi:hypothetical protein
MLAIMARAIANGTGNPVERARISLAYREDPSFFAIGRALGLHHQAVQRCVERAGAHGGMQTVEKRLT